MPRVFLVVVLLVESSAAHGQVYRVQPPNPTSADTIILDVGVFLSGMVLQPIVYEGSKITITFRGWQEEPSGGSQRVVLKPLPPGVYSVIVIMDFTTEDGGGGGPPAVLPPYTLVVGVGYFVPGLQPLGLFGLAVAMAAIGFVALRR